jgi:hypothetical protein
LTSDDLARARPYFDDNGLPSPTLYKGALKGHLGDVESDPAFTSFKKVLQWAGLESIHFRDNTAEPKEEQFWRQVDRIYDIKEEDLLEHLPLFVSDSRSRAKIEAGSYKFNESST